MQLFRSAIDGPGLGHGKEIMQVLEIEHGGFLMHRKSRSNHHDNTNLSYSLMALGWSLVQP
jgi:hypothetical protein